MQKSRIFKGGLILIVCLCALFGSACGRKDWDEAATDTRARVEYPGADDCRFCHIGQYEKWAQSGHGYKMNKVDPAGSAFPAYPFSSVAAMLNKVVSFNLGNFDGDLFTHAARDNTNTGFIIGGYGWKARYTDETGRIVHGADAQYNLDGGSFAAYHDKTDTFANGDTDAALANYDCGYCHTTDWKHTHDGGMPNHQTITDGMVNIAGEFRYAAITCQRCHGSLAVPANFAGGSLHNRRILAADVFAPDQYDTDGSNRPSTGGTGNSAGAYAFGQLATASNIVCSDCHNRGGVPSIVQVSGQMIRHHEQANELYVGRHGSALTPDADLTCIDCHDPHASTKYDALALGEGVYSTVMIDGDCSVSACHSGQVIDAAYGAGHTCIDCHMPYASKSAQSYTAGAESVIGVTALGTPSGSRGDLRTHIFALSSIADATQMDTDLDGSAAQVKLAVDFSCMSCHGTGGVMGPQDAAMAEVLLGVTPVHPLPPAVSIDTFTAAPGTIVVGSSADLTWTTTNAASCSIDSGVGAVALNDTVTVSPVVTTTYTLTANGPGGPVTQQITVTVDQPVTIDSFSAAPLTIVAGNSTDLTWTTSNATSCSIDNGVGIVAVSDTVNLSPAATTTYTLTANGPAGPVTQQVTVTVQPAVTIDTFTAAPTTIVLGNSTDLTWTTTNATTCSIDSGVGAVAVDGTVNLSPVVTTTYTLTANGPGGPLTQQVTVTVQVPVTIDSFSAAPLTITAGNSTDLTWTTSNATSCSIDNGVGAVAVDGTVNLSPAATTTYTLTASGPAGPVTQQVTVTVTAAGNVQINSCTAAPGTIVVGNSADLTWTTTDATSCSIDNGVGAVAVNGTTSVTPAVTTTYTLTANGPGGPVTQQVTVTVVPPVTIDSFSGNPLSIVAGNSTDLTWTTTNAISCSIDNGVGAVAVDGTANLSPAATTTYTLTANGPGGPLTQQVTITVVPPVVIDSFSGNPLIIVAGNSTDLTWTTSNATSCSIDNGVGAVAVDGTTNLSPVVTTTYTLTANGPGGPLTQQVTVTVQQPVTIDSFTGNPLTITAGNSTDLTWTTSNATSCSIDNGVGAVAADSTTNLSPAVTTTYTLTANGPGGPVTQQVTITVNAAVVSYAADIQPYFDTNCNSCHSTAKKGVILTSYASLMAGGDNGALVVPGDSSQGILIPKIQSGHKSAPQGILTNLAAWIDAGALND